MALQALALYSALVFSPDGSTTVVVASPSATYNFVVDKDNKLLYQEKQLKAVDEKHVLTATGSGCAAVQVRGSRLLKRWFKGPERLIPNFCFTCLSLFQFAVHYNVPTPVQVSTYQLVVVESANCTSPRSRPTVNLAIEAR